MASIKDKGNGTYRVISCNGTLPDGRINRKSWTISAKSMPAARKIANELEHEFKHGKMENKVFEYTFNDLIEKWREYCKPQMAKKSVERYEGMLKHHMKPAFGPYILDNIKPIQAQEYIASLKRDGIRVDNKEGGYSDKTIQSHYVFLHTLFDKAIKWEMISRSENIWDKIERPKINRNDAKYYDDSQIKMLIQCLDKEKEALEASLSRNNKYQRTMSEKRIKELNEVRRYNCLMHRTYVLMALASCCRRSELCGLEWNDFDFDNDRMKICRTSQYSMNEIYTTEKLKNGEPSKSMYLPNSITKLLKELKVQQEIYKSILGDDWNDWNRVFTSEDGRPVHPNNISLWFKRFLSKYNLPYITLHQVRHTSISYMLMQNVPIGVVAERAGHRDISVTSGIYGHVFDKNKKEVVETINKMFE